MDYLVNPDSYKEEMIYPFCIRQKEIRHLEQFAKGTQLVSGRKGEDFNLGLSDLKINKTSCISQGRASLMVQC